MRGVSFKHAHDATARVRLLPPHGRNDDNGDVGWPTSCAGRRSGAVPAACRNGALTVANGRPGDSVHGDIVHHGREVFGPACDGLVREITARLQPSQMHVIQSVIERWPFDAQGQPIDVERLHEQLLALRETLPPPPPPIQQPAPPPPILQPAPARRGSSVVAAVLGLIGFFLGSLGAAGGVLILSAALGLMGSSGDRGITEAVITALVALLAALVVGVAMAIAFARLGRR